MTTPELISYIQSERAKGVLDAVIKANLLANGWAEQDFAEAITLLSTGTSMPKPPVTDSERKKYLNRRTWQIFFILTGIDAVVIFLLWIYFGMYGIFGLGALSIVARILIIYLISFSTARSESNKGRPARTVGESVGRILGAIVIAILVGTGLLFITCFGAVFLAGGWR